MGGFKKTPFGSDRVSDRMSKLTNAMNLFEQTKKEIEDYVNHGSVGLGVGRKKSTTIQIPSDKMIRIDIDSKLTYEGTPYKGGLPMGNTVGEYDNLKQAKKAFDKEAKKLGYDSIAKIRKYQQ